MQTKGQKPGRPGNEATILFLLLHANTLIPAHTHTHTLHIFTHIYKHTYTPIHTCTHINVCVCTHVLGPRSITEDMVQTSGSADPLNVNVTITYVSTVKLGDNVGFNNVTYQTLQLDTTTRSTERKKRSGTCTGRKYLIVQYCLSGSFLGMKK